MKQFLTRAEKRQLKNEVSEILPELINASELRKEMADGVEADKLSRFITETRHKINEAHRRIDDDNFLREK